MVTSYFRDGSANNVFTLRYTNVAMEHGPFEDEFPTKKGTFHCHVSLPEGKFYCIYSFFVFLIAAGSPASERKLDTNLPKLRQLETNGFLVRPKFPDS